MIRNCLFLFIIPLLSFGQKSSIYTHSHNDYLQTEPLFTAVKFQMNSIEIDVALYKKEVKVCHIPIFLKSKSNFEQLYLKPLLENKNKLSSVKFLFIDIKSSSSSLLKTLNNLLSEYDVLFKTRNSNKHNKIQVIISGSVNRSALVKDNSLNYLFADGGFGDLSKGIDSNLMPVISANYKSLSKKDRKILITLAHKENKKVRFWNTTDNKKSWKKLVDLNVDFIGVDNIENFSKFQETL